MNFLFKFKKLIWFKIWYLNSKVIFLTPKINISILKFEFLKFELLFWILKITISV